MTPRRVTASYGYHGGDPFDEGRITFWIKGLEEPVFVWFRIPDLPEDAPDGTEYDWTTLNRFQEERAAFYAMCDAVQS